MFYGRHGCHVCDAALEAVEPIARQLGLRIEVVDIDGSDELLRRYMFEIPVLALDGQEIAKSPMSPRAMLEALEEAVRG